MPPDLGLHDLSYEDLRREADRFLAQYHTERTLPVPIETIVEFDIGLNIIPIPGLKQTFDVECFSSSDLRSISVDKAVCEIFKNRYRFSLAHEVGHRFLHRRIFTHNSFAVIKEWKAFIAGISERDYSTLEYQAYSFAGLVLVPQKELFGHLGQAKNKATRAGLSLTKNQDVVFSYIVSSLARLFEVSTAVIEKRIRLDHLWP